MESRSRKRPVVLNFALKSFISGWPIVHILLWLFLATCFLETAQVELTDEELAEELELLESICLGKLQLLPVPSAGNGSSAISCHYLTLENPYLLIGPLKMEVINAQPEIRIYHDFISESEMEALKEQAKSKLKESGIGTNHSVTQLRVSQSAWLQPSGRAGNQVVVERINQRIGMATGLEMSTSEALLVLFYQAGGYYVPHYDFFSAEREDLDGTGNRIATFLLYMSDVEQGGATIFTKLNVTIWPEKGSGAFWYNLHEDGSADELTSHMACPVQEGTKWGKFKARSQPPNATLLTRHT